MRNTSLFVFSLPLFILGVFFSFLAIKACSVEHLETNENKLYLFFYEGGKVLSFKEGKISYYNPEVVSLECQALPWTRIIMKFPNNRIAEYLLIPDDRAVFKFEHPIDRRYYFFIGGQKKGGTSPLINFFGEKEPIMALVAPDGKLIKKNLGVIAFKKDVQILTRKGLKPIPQAPLDSFLFSIRKGKVKPIKLKEQNLIVFKNYVILLKIENRKLKILMCEKSAPIVKLNLLKTENLNFNKIYFVPSEIRVDKEKIICGTENLFRGFLFNIKHLFNQELPTKHVKTSLISSKRFQIVKNGEALFYPPIGIALSNNIIPLKISVKVNGKDKYFRPRKNYRDSPYLYLLSDSYDEFLYISPPSNLEFDEYEVSIVPLEKKIKISANGVVKVYNSQGNIVYQDPENIVYSSEPWRFVRKLRVTPRKPLTVRVKILKRIPKCGEIFLSKEKIQLFYKEKNGRVSTLNPEKVFINGQTFYSFSLKNWYISELEVKSTKESTSLMLIATYDGLPKKVVIDKRWKKVKFSHQLVCLSQKKNLSIYDYPLPLKGVSSKTKRKILNEISYELLPVYWQFLHKKSLKEITINPELSRYLLKILSEEAKKVEKELEKKGLKDKLKVEAGAVVLDAKTRRIIAMASYPYPKKGSDLALLAIKDAWSSRKERVLRNRALDIDASPGSTFKIVTSLAAFKSGVITPENNRLPPILGKRNLKEILFKGKPLPIPQANFRRERALHDDFLNAFAHSYNIYFSYLALLMHEKLKKGFTPSLMPIYYEKEMRYKEFPLLRVAEDVGFNKELIEGFSFKSFFPETFKYPKEVADAGIGQFGIVASPLQMATVAGVIYDGNVIFPSVEKGKIRLVRKNYIKEEVRETIEKAMHAVITKGTAKNAFKDFPLKAFIYGKTGTAETPESKKYKIKIEDGWFVAFTKGLKKDVIVAVCIKYSGTGAKHSAKVVKQFLKKYYEVFPKQN